MGERSGPYNETLELARYLAYHYGAKVTGFEWHVIKESMLRREGDEALQGLRARFIQRCKVEPFINRCPRCVRVVRTPKAQQCFWCGYDWHPQPAAKPS